MTQHVFPDYGMGEVTLKELRNQLVSGPDNNYMLVNSRRKDILGNYATSSYRVTVPSNIQQDIPWLYRNTGKLRGSLVVYEDEALLCEGMIEYILRSDEGDTTA